MLSTHAFIFISFCKTQNSVKLTAIELYELYCIYMWPFNKQYSYFSEPDEEVTKPSIRIAVYRVIDARKTRTKCP